MQLEWRGDGRYIGGVRQLEEILMTAYLVSKTTKEHFLARNFSPMDANDEDLILVKGGADGWIEWSGGECPLPDNVRYKTIHASGYVFDGNCPQTFTNHWIGHEDPVVKYRPILDDDKPQAPEWNGEGLPPVETVCSLNSDYHLCGDQPLKMSRGDRVIIVGHVNLGFGPVCLIADENKKGSGTIVGECLRPIRTDREKWINQAAEVALQTGDALGNVYDALKSGDLPQP